MQRFYSAGREIFEFPHEGLDHLSIASTQIYGTDDHLPYTSSHVNMTICGHSRIGPLRTGPPSRDSIALIPPTWRSIYWCGRPVLTSPLPSIPLRGAAIVDLVPPRRSLLRHARTLLDQLVTRIRCNRFRNDPDQTERIDRTLTTIAHLGLALAGIGTIGKLIIEGAP